MRKRREPVKCADCGYLGVRNKDNQTIVSPGKDQRDTGRNPIARDRGDRILDTVPVCGVGAWDLQAKTAEAREQLSSNASADANAAKEVMHEPRTCKRFTEWIQALVSPKEHIDMNLLEKQRKWQAGESRKTTWILVIGMLASAIVGAWISRPATVQTPPTSTASAAAPRDSGK